MYCGLAAGAGDPTAANKGRPRSDDVSRYPQDGGRDSADRNDPRQRSMGQQMTAKSTPTLSGRAPGHAAAIGVDAEATKMGQLIVKPAKFSKVYIQICAHYCAS